MTIHSPRDFGFFETMMLQKLKTALICLTFLLAATPVAAFRTGPLSRPIPRAASAYWASTAGPGAATATVGIRF